MSKIKLRQAKLKDFDGFLVEFTTDNDRATVVLGAAILDALLVELIRKFLIDDPTHVDNLVEAERPLGSFGGRILLLYCLGILDESHLRTFRLIKNMRNIFAHQLHGFTFETPEIAELCLRLEIWNADRPATISAKDQFTLAIFLLSGHLQELIDKTTHREKPINQVAELI